MESREPDFIYKIAFQRVKLGSIKERIGPFQLPRYIYSYLFNTSPYPPIPLSHG